MKLDWHPVERADSKEEGEPDCAFDGCNRPAHTKMIDGWLCRGHFLQMPEAGYPKALLRPDLTR